MSMCGLAGVLNLAKPVSHDDLMRIAGAMGDTVRHRGPDEDGAWADAKAGFTGCTKVDRASMAVGLKPA